MMDKHAAQKRTRWEHCPGITKAYDFITHVEDSSFIFLAIFFKGVALFFLSSLFTIYIV